MIYFSKLFERHKLELRKSKGWVNVNCPFCKNPPDTHCNGGFSESVPAFNCWRCGKHNWVEALSLIFQVSPTEAKKMALNFSAGSATPLSKKVSLGKNLKMPGYESFTEVEKDYLERRGFFIPEVKRKFGIRGGGIAGEWSYRILIPIFYNGRLVSWTGRSILPKDILDQDKIPRYKNLSVEKSEINPKDIFFNLDNSRNDSVILVEGPFDVLKMGNDTICSLGTSVTSAQKLLLLKRYKKVFIAFDNEPAAQEKGRVLGKDLNSLGLDVEVVNVCEDYCKNDPGELVKKEVVEIKKELGLFDEKEYDDVFQEDLR